MIIDFHTHVFSPQVKKDREKYITGDPVFAMLYNSKNARLATADELIESMDQDGVAVSVILNIGWTTHDLCVATNDYILESVARYPKRLIGFCSIQPLAAEAALIEVERCAQAGARGIGEMRPDGQLFDLADNGIMRPVIEVMQEHRLIFLTHTSEPVGHSYPGKGTLTPGVLYPFLAQFPDLPVVCAHWGGGLPFYALMPEVGKVLSNVYFDSAASPFLYRPQVFQQVAGLVGAERVLFGSDYPLLSQKRLLVEIQAAGLPDKERELVIAGNARRLLGI
ncbi:MAG: amidohydrolase [Chloroflexi bacterium]|nr:amidohydrolase [Chloroflexota bacterium]